MRMNNFLSTLNIPEIQDQNLKLMERRAGDLIEIIATESTRAAASEAFKAEMEEVFFFNYISYISGLPKLLGLSEKDGLPAALLYT